MAKTLKNISDQLRSRRERARLSYAEVARRAGITAPTVAAAESGRLGNVGTLALHLGALGLELRAVRVRG